MQNCRPPTSGWADRRHLSAGAEGARRHGGLKNRGDQSWGILVVVGIVLAILLGHWWIGLIVALVGLLFFGGFAKGKWY